MKKLKMIVTSVIVLAIVGSAFTYKAKKGAFCYTDEATSRCTSYTTPDFKIVTNGGTPFKYYPFWDGDGVACTAPNNTLCTVSVLLSND